MLRLFSNCRLSTTVNHFKLISNSKLISTVDLLKERANRRLEDYDNAGACEESYKACKIVMMDYVKKLESTSNIKIVPEKLENPWNYEMFSKLCRLMAKKVDRDMALEITHGWSSAFVSQARVSEEYPYDISREEVGCYLPAIFRLLDIFDKELKVDQQMASYIKENLFDHYLDQSANEINKDPKDR